MDTTTTIDAKAYREGMRKLAGAVTIITTDGKKGRGGFTATAVCSVSDTPPTLLVCVNETNDQHDTLLENGQFAVNVLREQQDWLSNRFAGFDGTKGEERFQAGEWQEHAQGVPYLKDGLVSFICQVKEVTKMATHSVVFGEVIGVVGSDHEEGLLYFNAGYRTLKVPTETH